MENIKNSDELEFAIFCIENIAARLGKSAEDIYTLLTEGSNLLNGYVVPNFEILHTQGKDYIVEDIISAMEEEGVKV